MKLNTYLIFNGNCKEAFKFYEQVLHGKTMMTMTFGESPMHDQSKPEERDLIMHTSLQFGDQVLMGSDAPSAMPFQPPQGFHISIGVDDVAEAERIYKALSAGGASTTATATAATAGAGAGAATVSGASRRPFAPA